MFLLTEEASVDYCEIEERGQIILIKRTGLVLAVTEAQGTSLHSKQKFLNCVLAS